MDSQFTKILWSLNKDEIDMINVLINIVERNDRFDEDIPFDYQSLYYMIDTNLHELSASLGFLHLSIDHVSSVLEALTTKSATMYFEEGSDRIMKKGPFVQEFMITASDKDVNKRIQIWVNTRLIKILRDDKKMFELLYRFDKYDLRSKYSKLLYEMFGKKPKTSLTISVDDLIDELDYDIVETKNKSWSRLNSNILKRAVKELEEKSNLSITYAKIKEKDKKDNRVKTAMIQIETTAAPEIEEPGKYFTDDFLMERKIAYYLEREVNRRYKAASRFGTINIRNEEAYKAKVRRELKKFHKEYEARVLLQEWINMIKYQHPNIHGLVVIEKFQGYEYVAVNNDYILIDIKSKKPLSANAMDTREKIKKFLNEEDGEYTIIETNGKIKNCSISYTKG